MRLACPEERLDCLPISEVELNLECRDEIIPILRALQKVYADADLRHELLALIGQDVNGDSSRIIDPAPLTFPRSWESKSSIRN